MTANFVKFKMKGTILNSAYIIFAMYLIRIFDAVQNDYRCRRWQVFYKIAVLNNFTTLNNTRAETLFQMSIDILYS